MRTKFLTFCALLTALFVMCGCGEQCKGFPDELTDYLPYRQGQIITFVNEYSDTLSLQVDKTYRSQPYKINGCGKCECPPPIYKSTFSVIDNIDYLQTMTCEIETGESYFVYVDFLPMKGHIGVYFSEMTDTINLTNLYEDPIRHVKIVRGKGVTSFTDRDINCTWQLLEY